MKIQHLTREDLNSFGSRQYRESVIGLSVKDDNGEVVGVVGVIYTAPLQAFSAMSDKLRKSPKTIVKTAKLFRGVLDTFEYPVYAIAADYEKTSPRFLEFVGFEPILDNYNGRLYRWRK